MVNIIGHEYALKSFILIWLMYTNYLVYAWPRNRNLENWLPIFFYNSLGFFQFSIAMLLQYRVLFYVYLQWYFIYENTKVCEKYMWSEGQNSQRNGSLVLLVGSNYWYWKVWNWSPCSFIYLYSFAMHNE